MIKDYIREMMHAGDVYKGSGMMLTLYFIALIMIFLYMKDEKRKYVIIFTALSSLLVIYTVLPAIQVFVRNIEAVSTRFFWILFTPFVTAIGLTIFVYSLNTNKKRVIVTLCLFIIVFLSGSFQLSKAMFKKAENEFRLPQSCVDIVETVLAERENPLLCVPYTIAHPFRQISSDVYLLYGEDATNGRIIFPKDKDFYTMCDEMERYTPDLDFIFERCRDYHVDYIVFDVTYHKLCKDGNVNVNNYPKDPNYVGDRTSNVKPDDFNNITVIEDDNQPYWDLSYYNLSYAGAYGQYLLYRFEY